MPESRSGPARTGARAVIHSVCLAAALLVAPALLATTGDVEALQPDLQYWKFRVLLDDREIGFHEFRVVNDGDVQQVATRAQFDVKILFFNAYRYRHENAETWRGGCLTGIRSTTDANGKLVAISGGLGESGFELDGPAGKEVLDSACVRSFAYWDPAMLRAEALLNAQSGELMPVRVDEVGPDRLEIGGELIPATRYRITLEDGAIDLWYGRESGRWLALKAPTEGGRKLRYEATAPAPGADDGVRLSMN